MSFSGVTRWDKGIQQMTAGTQKQEAGDLIGAAQHYDMGIQMMIDYLKTMPQSDRKLVKQAKVESYMDILQSVKEQIHAIDPTASIKLDNRIARPRPQPKQRAKLPKPKPKPKNQPRPMNSFNSNNRNRSNSNSHNNNNNNNRLNKNNNNNSIGRNRSKSEREFYNKIMSEVVSSNSSESVSFNDVIGLDNVKQALMESVILPAQRPDIFVGARSPPRGLLLFGPPGNGKTFIAKALAKEANCTFFSISASSLTSRYVGESEKLVRALFSAAREHAPSIIFIDEIDSILTSRGGDNEQESSRRMKTEFLVQMDGVSSGTGKERVLLVGATNLPWQLDDAVLRRFEKRILVPLPDAKQRHFIIMSKLKNDGQISFQLSDRDMASIVGKTEGYSASDLKNLVRDACMGPVRDLGMNVAKVKKVPPVKHSHFMDALQNIKPSSNKGSLNTFKQWNDEFGSKLNVKQSNNSNNNRNNSNSSRNNNNMNDEDYEMKSQRNVDDSKQPSQPAPDPNKQQNKKKWGGFKLFT